MSLGSCHHPLVIMFLCSHWVLGINYWISWLKTHILYPTDGEHLSPAEVWVFGGLRGLSHPSLCSGWAVGALGMTLDTGERAGEEIHGHERERGWVQMPPVLHDEYSGELVEELLHIMSSKSFTTAYLASLLLLIPLFTTGRQLWDFSHLLQSVWINSGFFFGGVHACLTGIKGIQC